MSNKIQINNIHNRITISYIKFLEISLKYSRIDLDHLNKSIFYEEILFKKDPDHISKLVDLRNRIKIDYKERCDELRRAQKNLVIC